MVDPETERVRLPRIDRVEALVSTLQATSRDFADMLRRDGRVGVALRRHGLAQWGGGRYLDAIDALGAALALSLEQGGDSTDLWRELAGAYDGMGDREAALGCVQAALQTRADDVQAWFLLGRLQSRSRQWKAAEIAFNRALELKPDFAEAHFGAGLAHFASGRPEPATASLHRALAAGYEALSIHLVLGHVRYLAGDFAGSACAFEVAAAGAALPSDARRTYVRACTYLAVIEDGVEAAKAVFHALTEGAVETIDTVFRDGFELLAGSGQGEAARALGGFRLEQNPGDSGQSYLLEALNGGSLARAPAVYVEEHFDRVADTFDRKLVDVLGYDAPVRMATLIGRTRASFDHILDLGCGTGLAAPHLAALGDRITGVDLSSRMLELAARRSLYTELAKAEALEFLNARPNGFDLVFAADVLVYFGDLEAVFEAVAHALAPSGYFALCVELCESASYQVLPSGRFAHGEAYLKRAAGTRFAMVEAAQAQLRLEGGRPVQGLFQVLRRIA